MTSARGRGSNRLLFPISTNCPPYALQHELRNSEVTDSLYYTSLKSCASNTTFSVISTKRELILFLLMYLFVQQPENGKAPIESIMPEASRMPLYKMINDPLGALMGVENVKENLKPVLAKAGNGRFGAFALPLNTGIGSKAMQRSPLIR